MARVFIVNPHARQGRLMREWERFKRPPGLGASDVEHVGSPESLVSQGFDEWVVVGGDGSLQRAIQVLLAARSRGELSKLPLLSVLPIGTGADFARSLGACGESGASVWQPADAGRVVLDGGEPRYFINVASVGFSARVAEAKGRMPSWIPRSLAYLLPTLLELPRAAPTRLRLTAAGAALEGQAWAVFICNGRFAGGGMRFGADARLDDGRFEVSWIEGISALGVLRKLPQVYSSRGLVEQPGVRKLEASDLVIEAPTGGSLLLDLDGEPTSATRAEFAILPAEEIGLHVRRLGRKPD